jgi:hypothetical protein
MGSKGSSPPPPDYAAAAAATAQSNQAAATAATDANRVNQITPEGSLTYTPPANPKNPASPWTVQQTYSQPEQQLFDQSNSLNSGLLGLANTALGNISNSILKPTTAADLPTSMVNAGQTGEQAYMDQAQPMLDQQREEANQSMAEQGIPVGSDAWNNEERALSTAQNQAQDSAITSGFGMGQQAQQQQLQVDTALQSQPINEIDALRSGTQVTDPNFTSVPQQQTTAGANYLGAAEAQGAANTAAMNASQSGTNAALGAVGTIGAGAAMAFF